MRKLMFAINITIDGCCDHTKVLADPQIHEHFTRLLQDDVDVLVFGRKTYELMVPFWPDIAKNPSGQTKSMADFAQAFDRAKKVVFSKTMERAEDRNTRIVRGNLREEILKLKQEEGKNVLAGGVNLTSQLIELGLVDEFQFLVHPVVAGEGTRLLKGVSLPETLKLGLVDSKFFDSGCVALRYRKQ